MRYEPDTTTTTTTTTTTSSSSNTNSDQIYYPQTGVTLGSIYNKDNNINSNSNGNKWGKPPPPTIDRKRPIVLVGKGVTYDTGGLNIKTGNSMKTMKHDMAGSAAALGLMIALG